MAATVAFALLLATIGGACLLVWNVRSQLSLLGNSFSFPEACFIYKENCSPRSKRKPPGCLNTRYLRALSTDRLVETKR